MPSNNIVKLNRREPTAIDYMGHRITLKYRPDYNDWQYEVKLHITYTVTRQSAFYTVAVRNAKKLIEKMVRSDAMKKERVPT